MKTYEQWAIEELKKIEPATRQQWAKTMGKYSRDGLRGLVIRCVKLNLATVDKTKRPYIYRIKKEQKEKKKEGGEDSK